MIQLVFTDVDGTLVGSSGTVLPAIWTAAERVRAAGIRMAVCSGRPAFGDAREVSLGAPATPEAILTAIERVRGGVGL